MLGIISYLPEDAELRKTRIDMIRKAMSSNNELFRLERQKIVVLQGYAGEEKELFSGFEYIYSQPVGAAKARNMILDYFEKTEESFLWVLDDDITFYPHYGFEKLVLEFKDSRIKADVITFLDPRMRGFREFFESVDVKNNVYFWEQQTMNTGTGAFLIKNSRLTGKARIRFREDYREKKFREDIAFLLDNIDAGKIVNTCPEVIYKWDNSDKGTIEQNKSSQKWIFQLQPHALELGLAKLFNLPVDTVSGNLDFLRYRKILNKTSKPFCVKRVYPLTDEDCQFKRPRVYSKKIRKVIEASQGKVGLLRK